MRCRRQRYRGPGKPDLRAASRQRVETRSRDGGRGVTGDVVRPEGVDRDEEKGVEAGGASGIGTGSEGGGRGRGSPACLQSQGRQGEQAEQDAEGCTGLNMKGDASL